jgi:hypothetical protein
MNLPSDDRDHLEFGRIAKLPSALVDPDSSEVIRELGIGPHNGKILLKNKRWLEEPQ